MKSFTLLATLFLLATTTYAEDDPPTPGGLGARCGGATFPQPKCDETFTCRLPPTTMPGQAGQCVPLAQIGEKCGGSIRYAAQCTPNAYCLENDNRMGAFGKCMQKFSAAGEECGGGTRYALQCDQGLQCVRLNMLAGGKGTCRRGFSDDWTAPTRRRLVKRDDPTVEINSLGGRCGGSVRYPPQCAEGFVCRGFGAGSLTRRSGAFGTCVPFVGLGENCGGSIRYPAQCWPNLKCQVHSRLMGAQGVCEQFYAREGEECGGGLQFSIPCAEGLRCEVFSMVVGMKVGAKGKCVQDA